MRRLAALFIPLLVGCASLAEAPPPPRPQSHAWASFDAGGIVAAEAHGLADRKTGRALTIDDPVRIASVSKLVVALGVMRLVEQGRLDLDRDVSHWLGWRLRSPAFPDRAITLRMLLSHMSSLRDDVDYAVPLGTSVRSTLADPRAFSADHAPGTWFTYSNLNFAVIGTVMERATGERLDLLMQRLVLAPLGLDACFNWTTCSDAAVARAAILHDQGGAVLRDDLGGRRPDCPVLVPEGAACDWLSYVPGTNGALFSPQGGLRISLRDLTVVGRLLLAGGVHGGRPFLRPASLDEMTRPQWRHDGGNGDIEGGFYCGYGLAVQLLSSCRPGDDLFGDGRAWIGHAGEAYGLRSGLWIDRESKRGIAYFATGIPAQAPRGRGAYPAIEEWLARRIHRPAARPDLTRR